MSISDNKITAFTNVNVGQADRPNLTALQIQQLLDSSPEELRVALNGLIDDLIATTDGASGLDNIGGTSVPGLTGNTGQELIESLKTLIDTLDGANVKNTGNETIAGVKTFSSSPLVPAPTTDLQASTKKYVDDEIALVVAGDFPDYYNNKISFDNLLTNTRYRVTEFDTPSAGSITETIKLVSDDSTYATRVTTFDDPVAGAITETIVCSALSVNNTFITTFDDPTASDITETGGTV